MPSTASLIDTCAGYARRKRTWNEACDDPASATCRAETATARRAANGHIAAVLPADGDAAVALRRWIPTRRTGARLLPNVSAIIVSPPWPRTYWLVSEAAAGCHRRRRRRAATEMHATRATMIARAARDGAMTIATTIVATERRIDTAVGVRIEVRMTSSPTVTNVRLVRAVAARMRKMTIPGEIREIPRYAFFPPQLSTQNS